jgi:uncharacterized protein (DUF362 family)
MPRYPVAIVRQSDPSYPAHAPFHPPARYPEFAEGRGEYGLDASNHVYASVREALLLLGLDATNAGTARWNPLAGIVRPGDTVFLKPNLITHRHQLRPDEWDSVITHGAVLRATLDYVWLALKGEGRVWLGDAPQTDSHWDGLMERTGLLAIRDWFHAQRGLDLEILDLRDEHYIDKDGIYVETVSLPGDPRGSAAVDLGDDSMFRELDRTGRRYYGAFYDIKETNEHHHAGRHEYAVSRSPLEADVFINVPKLKTHKKCGLTVNLKSLVGINANKNWLPHYAFGAPGTNGDQFDHATLKRRIENWIVVPAKQLLLGDLPLIKQLARRTKRVGYDLFGDNEEVVRSGNWHGNDTVWRMSLDLNRILMYGEATGGMRNGAQAKRWFSIVDGIVGMEGNGPASGDRRPVGLIVAGGNPVAVDAVCARLMGFDPARLALVARAFGAHRWPLIDGTEADIAPVSNVPVWNRAIGDWRVEDALHFRPHFGWKGAIEWLPESATAR